MDNKPTPKRVIAFSALCIAAVVAVGGYLAHVKSRMAGEGDLAAGAVPASAFPIPSGRLFYRHTGVGPHYGQLAIRDNEAGAGPRFVEQLQCEVVHASGGRGVCLTADRGVVTSYAAQFFNARTMAVSATLPLKGIPSRTRVSADGRLAGLTVFVSGHGYSSLEFSTQTLIVEAATGRVVADLEDFTITRDGQPFKEKDFNFWGVTFTPDVKGFFATLSSGGRHHLIQGDLATRTARVLRDNVECPSVSPDAKRVAYKKRYLVDGRITWQFHVLDLASGVETALPEKRNVDDQIEWLDNDHVLYAMTPAAGGASTEVWVAPVDGQGEPKLFLPNAYSPAIERRLEAAAGAARSLP